jgi:hypothetical protein
MRRCFGIFLGTIALGASVACAGELEGDEASYRAQHEPGCNVLPIFAQRCASGFCHGGTTPAEGLDLASGGVRSRLVSVNAKGKGMNGMPTCETRLLLDPSDVDRSYLLEKIESTTPQCGVPMPLTGRLTDAEKECIRTWATAIAGGPSKHDSGPPGPDSGGGGDSSSPIVDSGGTQ